MGEPYDRTGGVDRDSKWVSDGALRAGEPRKDPAPRVPSRPRAPPPPHAMWIIGQADIGDREESRQPPRRPKCRPRIPSSFYLYERRSHRPDRLSHQG